MAAIDCISTIRGTGPALFLIHGIGSRRQTWEQIIDELQDEYTCISYDLRGHGASPLPDGPFGLDELVEDLEALRARLGIEQAHFAGHSLGGMIGPAYARAHPERALSLGLLSTAAFRTADDAAKVMGVVRAMEENGIENTLKTLVSRWFTDEFVVAQPELIEARIKQVTDTDPDVFLNVFHIYAETEMSPWLHQVTNPSLVLTGENDGGCNPRLNQQIAAALPDAELVILEHLKHSIMIEASPLVARHMKRFLRAHK
ncbi:MAG: alpha/beta fold hydrolase [Gammaproteobacteria bacterium]|nr:alpha/beta fold hydrolase [Gammaproteobacteria bacterium]